MGAEDTPVAVNLIDDNIFQLFEKIRPFFVEGQQSEVQHIRVCENDIRRGLPYLFSLRGRRVAVIYYTWICQAKQGRELIQAPELVLFQPLEGEYIEGPGVRV